MDKKYLLPTLVFFAVLVIMPLSTFANGEVSRLMAMKLPEAIEFCGERVPLEREDVRERLELEMLVVMGNPVQTSLWLKRMPRFFPMIEEKLKEAGLPDDLKYVSVAESNLRADALSRAGAAGPWQFMRATGKTMGLEQTGGVDKRRDWDESTSAALEYLKKLYDEFGSWPLALASYNAGNGRVRQAMKEQGVGDYYGLKLPTETERYLFRIIAVKILNEEPERFGIVLDGAERYSPRDTVTYELKVKRNQMPVAALSQAAGVSYRYFRVLNPWMTGKGLSKGTYRVKLPSGGTEPFAARLDAWEAANPEPKFLTYRVKRGDNLYTIARKHSIGLGKLLSKNNLRKNSVIYPGQKLLIPVQ